jgi:hypothetical protein
MPPRPDCSHSRKRNSVSELPEWQAKALAGNYELRSVIGRPRHDQRSPSSSAPATIEPLLSFARAALALRLCARQTAEMWRPTGAPSASGS